MSSLRRTTVQLPAGANRHATSDHPESREAPRIAVEEHQPRNRRHHGKQRDLRPCCAREAAHRPENHLFELSLGGKVLHESQERIEEDDGDTEQDHGSRTGPAKSGELQDDSAREHRKSHAVPAMPSAVPIPVSVNPDTVASAAPKPAADTPRV